MSLRDLMTLFAKAFSWMIQKPYTQHQIPGKHYRGMDHDGAYRMKRNPAGSKLRRYFARRVARGGRI